MGNNTATATAVEAQLLHLDPADLIVDENVRTDTAGYAELLATLATDGVLQPLLGDRAPDGTLTIRDGQLRTLAAREIGLASVPVYVRGVHEADTTDRTRRRIVEQVNANKYRVPLKLSEEAAAVEQLSLTGMSATKIAKELHVGKPKVDAALATARSANARSAMDQNNLTLEQGAVLAQYDDDPQALHELLAAVAQGRFNHKAAELGQNPDKRRAIREKTAELTAQGYTVYLARPMGREGINAQELRLLEDSAGNVVTEHSVDPQYLRALVRGKSHSAWLDADGTEVDDDLIDWELDGEDPEEDLEPAEGLSDPRKLTQTILWTAEVEWWHNDTDAENLRYRTYRSHSESVDGTQGSDEEEEAERQARQMTRALNLLAEAAQTVRREKVREVLARKTLPKGTSSAVAKFLAMTMWFNHDLYKISRQAGSTKKIAEELLGENPMEAVAAATGERALIVALAITMAGHEADLPKDAWRGGPEYYPSVGQGRTRYLEFLTETFDYVLSDVEKVIAGTMTAEQIDIS
ncbi:ParB N-terminal domain-containing protein [Williamsia sp. 1135]|uniref:ParB/RepB/Spo0J family partition protein n=1 Tax=Williamsia sp. 1135 TaxID=1889262 RepID=UPI000A108B24|nr:ParB N-terminal domain-containing protein [Williamsia sp. 1135]ORM37786.1 hypothetical protein BFL43_03015 [Williamsia sp. 1135]